MAKSKSSPVSKQTSAVGPINITSPKDFDAAKQHFASAYGVALNDNLQEVDREVLSDVLNASERMFAEFPGVIDELNMIKNDRYSSAYAYASWSVASPSRVSVGSLMQDKAAANTSIQQDGTFHPKGTTVQSITAHELGHVMETAIVKKRHAGDLGMIYDVRKRRKVATEIVGQAAKRVKKTPAGKTSAGKPKTINALIREVSGYATKNRSEALAEMVGDVFANGSNAHPLSQEVWSILKQELG